MDQVDDAIEPTHREEHEIEKRWDAMKLMGLLIGTMIFALAMILVSADLVVRSQGT